MLYIFLEYAKTKPRGKQTSKIESGAIIEPIRPTIAQIFVNVFRSGVGQSSAVKIYSTVNAEASAIMPTNRIARIIDG